MAPMTTECFRGCCTSPAGGPPLDVRLSDVALDPTSSGDASGAAATPATTTTSSGFVRTGTYKGARVAVKMPTLRTTDDLDRFHKELAVHLSFDHPNLMPIVGAVAHPPKYAFVMPLARASLSDVVHRGVEGPRSMQEIVSLAMDIACGVEALHGSGYVHRDLKPANVVLAADDGRAQVIDFQLTETVNMLQRSYDEPEMRVTRGKPTGGFHKRLMVGTLEYMAPEVLSKLGHSTAADVYAFGILLNECLTRIFPFSDCHKERPGCHTVLEMGYGHQELKAAVVGEHLRPTLCANAPPPLNDLVQACWCADPTDRPTIAEVRRALGSILVSHALDAIGSSPASIEATPATTDPRNRKAGGAVAGAVAPAGEVTATLPSRFGAGPSLELRVGEFQTIGGRETQEDRIVSLHPFLGREDAYLLAVFDGHRGGEASAFCATHLEAAVADCCVGDEGPSMERVLERAMVRLDADFRAAHPDSLAGTTACVAVLCGSTLCVANCGDSRCVVGDAGGVVQLTRDHTTRDEGERCRVAAASAGSGDGGGGGALSFKFDTWRIGKAGLEVTRSIGDADVKGLGVCATPEVAEADVRGRAFLVLGTDGLWDHVGNEEVLRMIQDTVKQPSMSAQRLGLEAITRGSKDNISIVLCFLSPLASHETVYKNGALDFSHM